MTAWLVLWLVLLCTVHRILQTRILEWVAFPFSRGSSQLRDQTQVSCIVGRFFTSWATGKPKNTGVGSLSLLQWIFQTQESNWGLLHWRRVLYYLSYQGSPGDNKLVLSDAWEPCLLSYFIYLPVFSAFPPKLQASLSPSLFSVFYSWRKSSIRIELCTLPLPYRFTFWLLHPHALGSCCSLTSVNKLWSHLRPPPPSVS